MKKRVLASLLAAVVLTGAGCSSQSKNSQPDNSDSSGAAASDSVSEDKDKTKSTVQSDESNVEASVPAPVVEIEAPTGTLMGEDVFPYADEWKLPRKYTYIISKDGDINKNMVTAGGYVTVNGKTNGQTAMTECSYVFDGQTVYDFLPYSYYLKIETAKPDMRKITAHELAEIMASFDFSDDKLKIVAEDDFVWDEDKAYNSIADSERADKIYEAVQNIQYFPDGIFDGTHMNIIVPGYLVPTYYYWPGSNDISKRHVELQVNYNTMTMMRVVFDEYGDRDSIECLYSYPYELEKAAREKYGFSEEREAHRMPNPYQKTVYTTPESPQTDKKLVGKEVVKSEYGMDNTKYRYNYITELEKKASELGFGEGKFEYQEQLASGKAYPNMRKITADEIVKLFDNIKIYENFDYTDISICEQVFNEVIDEIKKIQYYPDAYFPEYHDSVYLYWPYADTLEERREEIQIFLSEGLVRLATYDENGRRTDLKDLYDLQKKAQEADANGTREEYPVKTKITEEEIRQIFEKATADIPPEDFDSEKYLIYNDPDVCLEWMEPYIKEIEKIQKYPDSYNAEQHTYIYYPDADNVKDRRVQIEVIAGKAWVILRKYRNDGTEKEYENIFHLSEYLTKKKSDNNTYAVQ